MANKRKSNVESLPLTPEEMKAIGEIELGPSRHEQFLNNHYKKLIVAVLAFMLLASAVIVYATWRARQEADAGAAAMAAMNVPAGAAESGEYDLATLEKLAASYTGTKAAATAELMRGMQLVSAGQEQQGIEALENLIANAADDFLRLRAQVFLAGHYMNGGDAAKATELWQTVSRAGHSPWEALALLTLGDLAKQSGDAEMARTYYTRLQEGCPASPLIVTVQQRLLQLGVDAPEPVAPEPPLQSEPTQQEPLPAWQPMDLSSGVTP